MARKALSGDFIPKNPAKYNGTYPIHYRSSWEQTAMHFFDSHPNIIAWSSESISIPYRNPLTGKWSMYIPDFLINYIDKSGNQHVEMIEIKPLKETPGYSEKRVDARTKLAQAINMAKWSAAQAFCAKRGISFRVMTERDLFGFKRKA